MLIIGELFISHFAFPFIGTWPIIRFSQDLFIVLVLIGVIIFGIIRLLNNPAKEGRKSRFFGSHTSGAWIVLWFILLVIFTLVMYRGAKINTEAFEGNADAAGLPWAFASQWVGSLLAPLGTTAEMKKARQTIYHDAEHPSHIVLPVIPSIDE